MGVAVGRLDFEDAVADVEDRNIEGAAAEVVDRHGLIGFLVQTVGERRRRRLVDDAEHFQPRDLAGVLGRLTLRVVEVRGHGDDRLRDLFAQIRLRVGLQLLQDHRGNFRRRIDVVADLDVRVAVGGFDDLVGDHVALTRTFRILAAHQPLDRKDRVLGVGHRLTLGGLPDQPLAGLGEGDDGRGRPVAFRVGDDLILPVVHYRHTAVGGTEVDAQNLAHILILLVDFVFLQENEIRPG